jgi:hypothetical protein
VALAGAVLATFAEREGASPYVLFTTHFLDIVKKRIVPEGAFVKYMVSLGDASIGLQVARRPAM